MLEHIGDVTLSGTTAGKVIVQTKSGTLHLTQVEAAGEVSLTDDFGDITFESGGAAGLAVTAQSCDIRLTGLAIGGTVTAHSDNGTVEVGSVRAPVYNLSSNSGSINVDGARGKLTARTDFGDISVVNAGQADLDLETSSGSVAFSGTLGQDPHTLHSDNGDITLTIPQATTLSFDLQTDSGNIVSAMSMTITGMVNEHHWVGSLNGGGASLTATTNSGDIQIKILTP